MKKKIQILALFSYMDDLLAAVKKIKEKRLAIRSVHSPVPNHRLAVIMGDKPSPIRFFTLTGGILGILLGFGLSAYTAWQWKFIVSAKPVIAPIPYVIVSFEFCILLAVIFNVTGFLLLSRLPRRSLPSLYDPRLTEDRFGVLIDCPIEDREEIDTFLQEVGAEEIHVSP